MVDWAVIWLVAGIALCAVELVLPTAFVAAVMGFSALAVGLLVAIAPLPFPPALQVLLWMAISGLLVWFSRRWVRQSRRRTARETLEAETIAEIPAGRAGRVRYEGVSWRAKCSDDTRAIAAEEPVYVVGRQGNTLLVMPVRMLDDPLPDLPAGDRDGLPPERRPSA